MRNLISWLWILPKLNDVTMFVMILYSCPFTWYYRKAINLLDFHTLLKWKLTQQPATTSVQRIFFPLTLLKTPFRRWKRFLKKYYLFFQINIFFWFLQKTSIHVENRNFYRLISFDTHTTANLLPLPILRKIKFFLKKNQISYVLRKSYYNSRILRQFWYNLVIKNFQSNIEHRTLLPRTLLIGN